MTNSPAISVIIPMYNAENYIAECLESILMQTLQDYEVIIVDDCSTDNSCAVVESYAEKFGGRLKLIHTEKNSGSGALPKNKGMSFSRGEYVYFVDDDDLIVETALEKLYTLAKSFDADVVHCERNFTLSTKNGKLDIGIFQSEIISSRFELDTDDLKLRVQGILKNNYRMPQWCYLVRRDFIFDKELSFPLIRYADDTIWSHGLVFYAERFLHFPEPLYMQRLTKDSIIRQDRTAEQGIKFWLNPIIFGIHALDRLMNRIEFFQQNPQYRCAILENFVHARLGSAFDLSSELQLPEIYATIREEFGKNFGENDVLVSFLLADLIQQQKVFVGMLERIAELEKK